MEESKELKEEEERREEQMEESEELKEEEERGKEDKIGIHRKAGRGKSKEIHKGKGREGIK